MNHMNIRTKMTDTVDKKRSQEVRGKLECSQNSKRKRETKHTKAGSAGTAVLRDHLLLPTVKKEELTK